MVYHACTLYVYIYSTLVVICIVNFMCRMYCSRRLRRIRKSLSFTSGHRHRYSKKPLKAAIINSPRYLYIPLYSAERAWSLAMELKQVRKVAVAMIYSSS